MVCPALCRVDRSKRLAGKLTTNVLGLTQRVIGPARKLVSNALGLTQRAIGLRCKLIANVLGLTQCVVGLARKPIAKQLGVIERPSGSICKIVSVIYALIKLVGGILIVRPCLYLSNCKGLPCVCKIWLGQVSTAISAFYAKLLRT